MTKQTCNIEIRATYSAGIDIEDVSAYICAKAVSDFIGISFEAEEVDERTTLVTDFIFSNSYTAALVSECVEEYISLFIKANELVQEVGLDYPKGEEGGER